MKKSLLLILLGATGCAQYSQVQIDLLNQSRKGIELAKQSFEEKSAAVSAYHAVQRRRLDDAFDADVSERSDFSAAWIIEHRRAYAAALDALATAKLASIHSDQTARENLDAVDLALQRVLWLQSAQLRFTSLSTKKEIQK